MKALGLGVLTGVLAATIAASLVFALTDRPDPAPDPAAGTGAARAGQPWAGHPEEPPAASLPNPWTP
ncbi:hypothetical protein ACWEPC_18375 [Nonomuraea sp. NPDC004297]